MLDSRNPVGGQCAMEKIRPGDMVDWSEKRYKAVVVFFRSKYGNGPFKVDSTMDGPGSQVVYLSNNGTFMRQFSSDLFEKV
ncbi:MAG: hypothetical protein HGA31_02620 [Candidatus Moranbacteria bacterium]|nr:hypothetical protein [Candidatus Moranbacteria bacterium]